MKIPHLVTLTSLLCLAHLLGHVANGQRRPRRLTIRRPSGDPRVVLPNRFSRAPRRRPFVGSLPLSTPDRELVVPALQVPLATVQQGSHGVRSLQHFLSSSQSPAPPDSVPVADSSVAAAVASSASVSTERPPLSREQRAMLLELQTILGSEPLPIDDPTSERPRPAERGDRSLPLFPPYDTRGPSDVLHAHSGVEHLSQNKPPFDTVNNLLAPSLIAAQNTAEQEEYGYLSGQRGTASHFTETIHQAADQSQPVGDSVFNESFYGFDQASNPVQQALLNQIASDSREPIFSETNVDSGHRDNTIDYISQFRQVLLNRVNGPSQNWRNHRAEPSSDVDAVFRSHQSSRRNGLRPFRGFSQFHQSGSKHSETFLPASASVSQPVDQHSASTEFLSPVFQQSTAASSELDSATHSSLTGLTGGLNQGSNTATSAGDFATTDYNNSSTDDQQSSLKANRLLAIMPQEPDLLCSKTEALLGFCDTTNKYPRNYMDRVLEQCSTILDYLYSEVPELSSATHVQQEAEGAADHLAAVTSLYPDWSRSQRGYFHSSAAASGSGVTCWCRAHTRQLLPTYGRATDGRWYVLLQHGHVRQRVTVDQCTGSGGGGGSGGDFASSASSCQQKFLYRTLIAADPRLPTKCPRMRTFRFPAGCTCPAAYGAGF